LPEISGKLKGVLDKANTVATTAQGSLDELNVSLKNIKVVTTDFASNSKQWNQRITDTIDRANSAMSRIDNLVDTQQQTVIDALANVKDATADAKTLVAGLKNETLTQLNTAMTSVQETMTNLKSASSKVRDFVAGSKPVLERTMANAQISAEQLKLATVEIRRSPWRLLHTPSEEELETDNLYDAARSFALAASALQSASASLDSVAQQQDADPQQVKQMVEHLGNIFDKFKATEKIFWDTLNKYGKPQTPATSKK
jgi:ABC-type transporter Mla subunit MlaD